MQQLNPSEISEIIKQRIEKLDVSSEARNEGTIVSVSDGIVRIHGLGRDIKLFNTLLDNLANFGRIQLLHILFPKGKLNSILTFKFCLYRGSICPFLHYLTEHLTLTKLHR
jgi:hypothetical protein